tara:strand:+ start:217 stop:588 length:372 start_codon:yes stop_codon:yes gene_type:complete
VVELAEWAAEEEEVSEPLLEFLEFLLFLYLQVLTLSLLVVAVAEQVEHQLLMEATEMIQLLIHLHPQVVEVAEAPMQVITDDLVDLEAEAECLAVLDHKTPVDQETLHLQLLLKETMVDMEQD